MFEDGNSPEMSASSNQNSSRLIAEVILVSGLDKSLTYSVPEFFREKIAVGSLVKVPLRNRTELGIVSSFLDEAPSYRLKSIESLIYEKPVLTEDLLYLAFWMHRYYGASFESIIEAMVPAPVRKGMGVKSESYYGLSRLLSEDEAGLLRRRAPKQFAIYDYLTESREALSREQLVKGVGASSPAIKALVEKEILVSFSKEKERVAYDDTLSNSEKVVSKPPEMTEEQSAAVSSITQSLNSKKFVTHLLEGVTGSGKTEVYIRVIEKTIAEGGGVILLVPEVTLTPQTVGRLRSRLEERGMKAVVWHSLLSDGERFDAWNSIVEGRAQVVVGARSAVFAPMPNLRLVIVDEEHEPAYKQEDSPRYHGRDVAVYRAMLKKGVCILGSATPSLESLNNVNRGKYKLNRLLKRVDDRNLPSIEVVDMKCELHKKNAGGLILSESLSRKLRDCFHRGDQSILFINRRGYSRSVICPDCGYVAQCRECSVSLTYHRTDHLVRCHLCGFSHPLPRDCPECDSGAIRRKGLGTQRVEEVVQKFLPQARVVRMDTDSMRQKDLFRSILSDFREGKIDVLIGTQMIAKGLDFPNVTLVGLIDADISLHLPDFRASERTFQLLVQVSGRSGRGEKPGEVVIQTFTPQAMPIQFAKRSQFSEFFISELELRKEFQYPPHRHLIRHVFRGKNVEKVSFYAEQWAAAVNQRLSKKFNCEMKGPAPAPIEKIKNDYRYHLWYFTKSVEPVVAELLSLRSTFKMDKGIVDVLDVDPVNLI